MHLAQLFFSLISKSLSELACNVLGTKSMYNFRRYAHRLNQNRSGPLSLSQAGRWLFHAQLHPDCWQIMQPWVVPQQFL